MMNRKNENQSQQRNRTRRNHLDNNHPFKQLNTRFKSQATYGSLFLGSKFKSRNLLKNMDNLYSDFEKRCNELNQELLDISHGIFILCF